MDENELSFSWSLLFYVTGISCFLFSFIVKLLEQEHSLFLLTIGGVALSSGILNSLIKAMSQNLNPRKRRSR